MVAYARFRRALMIMEDMMALITIACDLGGSLVNFQFTNMKQAQQFYPDEVSQTKKDTDDD